MISDEAYSQQEYQRTLVILLEDFGGESLEYWMQQRPDIFCPMSLSAFLRLAIDLTDILGKIHAAHIIHKDINPSNIVLNHEQCILRVRDDGQGFRVGSVPRNGFGLLGMSERAERIDAQLRIQSESGQGTEIVITIQREQAL